MTEKYNLNAHCMVKTRYFEEFTLGEIFCIPSRTQTEALFAAFQLASGDNHPIHYDRDYCRRHGHRDLLAHGLQIMCQTAAGAGLFADTVGDSLKGMLEMGGSVKKPVYCGDTLYPKLVVSELKEGKTTGVITLNATVYNQDGEIVFEGFHRYLIKKRPAA